LTFLGWTICPTDKYQTKTCTADKSWINVRPDQQTSLSVFRQYTTTAYDRQNFSIINVQPVSPPQSIAMSPDDFKAIWAKLFDPGSNATSDDAAMVGAAMFELGWYLRLYKDRFSDDGRSPVSLLQNFLAVPIQFSTVGLQFSNATIQAEFPGSGIFPIPSDLETTASAAHITPRFIGQLWAVCVFIAICSVLVLYAGGLLGWILFQKPLLTDPSAFPEFDILSNSGCATEQRRTLRSLAQSEEPTNAGSWKITRVVREKTGQVVRVRCQGESNYHQVFVLPEDTAPSHGIGLEKPGQEGEN
jgi:hypothetical protein